MYIPTSTKIEGDDVIEDFISIYGFGLIVSPSLEATHLPLLFEPRKGSKGILHGHFAKANSQWKNLENHRVLVVFSGPHSYISPTWYEQKPAVPTWNYISVHCYGKFELLDDAGTLDSMDALVRKYEPDLLNDSETMPPEYKLKLSQAVVGFQIVIDDIQGKEKLGQHRSQGDQKSVYLALKESTYPDSNALSTYMKKRNLGIGS